MILTNHQLATIVVNVVFPLAAAVAVLLRCWVKKSKTASIHFDDYLIIFGLICTLGNCLPLIYCAVDGGMGNHLADLNEGEMIVFGSVTFWTQFPYIFAVSVIKLALLVFYRNIFVTSPFRIATKVMMTILLLWTIAFFFASLFQALPISSNWDPNIQPQSEINEQDMYNALACTELVTDVVILIMPLTMIWRLRLKASKKWALSGVFLLGSLACIASAVRIYYYTTLTLNANVDFTYEAFNVFLWTSIEPCLGIVAACLPVLGPLFRETRSLASVFNSVALFSRLRSRNRSHQSDIISEQKQPPLVHDGVDREAIIMTTIKSKSDMLTQCSETDSAEGITVNTAISQTQHDRL